ncbi:hypothetical protein FGO68_gene10346 [Halteria grandinella]|uniref:Uncharacterized protein n=1 Tax=Halteria grandinella TaxID=5974 RepID=A0A8J8SZZ0_HALGN|nr:hypothetical protein FGO68_gene10346 [Halteria grandinella]
MISMTNLKITSRKSSQNSQSTAVSEPSKNKASMQKRGQSISTKTNQKSQRARIEASTNQGFALRQINMLQTGFGIRGKSIQSTPVIQDKSQAKAIPDINVSDCTSTESDQDRALSQMKYIQLRYQGQSETSKFSISLLPITPQTSACEKESSQLPIISQFSNETVEDPEYQEMQSYYQHFDDSERERLCRQESLTSQTLQSRYFPSAVQQCKRQRKFTH